MATTKVQGTGLVVQHTNTSHAALSSDDLVLLGYQGLMGLALEDIANNAAGSIEVAGGFIAEFPVTAHNGAANTAVAIYDVVYFTDGDAFADVDPAQIPVGYALGAVTSGATTTVDVLITHPKAA